MKARRLPIFVIVGVVALVVVANLWAGPSQRDRIAEAVPGFACSELFVKTYRTSYNWRFEHRRASSALRMPAECRARLERMVSGPPFVEEPCGRTRRCWNRRIDDRRYRFEFADGYVGFSFSYYPS